MIVYKGRGNYSGTTIDRRWWRRYRGKTFFARGSGGLWLEEEEGLFFRRYLTKRPLFIPFSAMTGIRSAKWHGGRWGAGRDFLVIDWRAEGLSLSSGFLLSRAGNLYPRMRAFLEGQVQSSSSGMG